MATKAIGIDILQRIDQADVGRVFVHGLHVTGVAKLAEIAKSMGNMPITRGIDRILRLHFVTILA
jgi:hypothetical protein